MDAGNLGGSPTSVFGMNNDGVLVGGSGTSSSYKAAFVASPDIDGNYSMAALPPTVPSDYYYAAVWNTESPVPSYTTLPGLSSNTTRSFVRDANDAGWAVGSSVEKINKKTSKTEYVFWKDGAATVFSAMVANAAVSNPSPWTINAAGIIAGTGTNASGEDVVFVGIPSEAP